MIKHLRKFFVGNAASAFRVTELYPFDNNLFTKADFALSLVTNMFCPLFNTAVQNPFTLSSFDLDQDAVESQKAQSCQTVSVGPVAHEFVVSVSGELLETQFEILNILSFVEVHHPPSSLLITKHNIETDVTKTNEQSHALSDLIDKIGEFQEQQILPSSSIFGNILNTQKSPISLINCHC